MTTKTHTFTAAGIVSVLALTAGAALVGPSQAALPPASPGHGLIAPHQLFGGLINGSDGFTAPVTIKMACFGPVHPGQTGHPMPGQNVSVFRPEAIHGTFGNTGRKGHIIGAFFGPPPPAASPGASDVMFHRYATKALPTTLTLPCAGSGNVLFVAFPTSRGSSSASVPVNYVGQP
jgi:hypothetical protein